MCTAGNGEGDAVPATVDQALRMLDGALDLLNGPAASGLPLTAHGEVLEALCALSAKCGPPQREPRPGVHRSAAGGAGVTGQEGRPGKGPHRGPALPRRAAAGLRAADPGGCTAGESLQVQRAEEGKLRGVIASRGVAPRPALDRDKPEGAVPHPDPPGQIWVGQHAAEHSPREPRKIEEHDSQFAQAKGGCLILLASPPGPAQGTRVRSGR